LVTAKEYEPLGVNNFGGAGGITPGKGTGVGAYSNSVVVGLLNPEQKPRLLVQASHAYRNNGSEASASRDFESATQSQVSNIPLTYRRFLVEEKDGRVVRTTPVSEVPGWAKRWAEAEGEGAAIPDNFIPRWASDVSKKKKDWSNGPDPKTPYFKGPIRFVHPPKDEGEPFLPHNHVPAITWLENGDLLASWISTRQERGPELTILASRLRDGADTWDPSSEFFKAPDRNMMHTCLSRDTQGTIYHFNGMTPEGDDPAFKGYENMALMLRTSKDLGVTWSPAEAILPRYSFQHMPCGTMFRASNGLLIQNCDWYRHRLSTLVVSSDNGKTWSDRSEGEPVPPAREKGTTGKGFIAGTHAGVIEISNDRLMALGRTGWGKPNRAINGKMPKSISTDWGKTWTYTDSPFPIIASGQRLVLMRLQEGPILLVSFTGTQSGAVKGGRKPDDVKVGDNFNWNGMEFIDSNGKKFKGYGMFAALSYDEGETWPDRRLLTPGSGSYKKCGGWTGNFTATPTRAEPGGYLTATQTPDGVIHLLSSAHHYRFNLVWLESNQWHLKINH
jgi:hypothetical protein